VVKITEETQVILEGRTRVTSNGKRHLKLTKAERAGLIHNEKIEEAVACYLDLESDLSNKEIADRLGISLSSLKRLVLTPEFTRIYEEALAMLGHSPRLMATAQALPDLLPAAFRTLRRLVTSSEVPDAVALKAAERILAINRVGSERNDEDPRDLAKFLEVTGTKVDGNLNILQFNMPDAYKNMFEQAFGKVSEVIDVPVGPIESPEDQPVLAGTEMEKHDLSD
jgi:hypothetical protein